MKCEVFTDYSKHLMHSSYFANTATSVTDFIIHSLLYVLVCISIDLLCGFYMYNLLFNVSFRSEQKHKDNYFSLSTETLVSPCCVILIH